MRWATQGLALRSDVRGALSPGRCVPVSQVTIAVAIIYLALAVFRLGFLCNLLSRPIISAFLTAGAITISLSQVCPHCCPASHSHPAWMP